MADDFNSDFFALPGLPSIGFEDNFSSEERDKNFRQNRQMCSFTDNREECLNEILEPPGFTLKRDNWVMPMLGLSSMNVLVILAFEIFVICKATGNTPSRR